ncbi:MAG: hypothetical protein NT092_14720 [Bacteroidia bacterium]|nr:hypothetical protein [Bacteroidia bacterium]
MAGLNYLLYLSIYAIIAQFFSFFTIDLYIMLEAKNEECDPDPPVVELL